MSSDALPAASRPNLLCIGAAKAGTTWLANVFSAHPDVFVPPQKELNALHYADLEDRLTEYAAYFASAGAARVRGDFSVRYLSSPRAPQAARRYVPDATILAVLRNPVDQVQSHYWHLLRQNFHAAEPVAHPPGIFEALEQYPDLLLEPALYGKHLARWSEAFPRERIVLIRHESLAQGLNSALEGVVRQLGIAPFDFDAAARDVADSDSRRGVRPRGGALGAIYPRLYTAVVRGPYQWLKRSAGVAAAERLKRVLRLKQASEAVFFQPGYPKIGQRERVALYGRFRPDLEQLADTFNFEIRGWDPGP